MLVSEDKITTDSYRSSCLMFIIHELGQPPFYRIEWELPLDSGRTAHTPRPVSPEGLAAMRLNILKEHRPSIRRVGVSHHVRTRVCVC